MFTRHAKFRSPEFSRIGLGHAMPHWLAAAHADDSSRDHRRRTGQRRSPQPRLACRWVLTGENRLECRWQIERPDDVCVEEPDGRSRHTRNIRIAADGSEAAPGPGGSAGFHITVVEPSYQERVGWSGVAPGRHPKRQEADRNFTLNASVDPAAISLEPTVSAASWGVGLMLE